ncbi:MAG TPA: hypothetical protein VJ464_16890 [Blastocatellia bacterium]|nr:hypothetical protein [Blastocatellia bacterium]
MNETAISFFIVGKCSKERSVSALPGKAGGRELSRGILAAIATANQSFEQDTARLLRLAELAYGRRDDTALEAITGALESIPFQPAQRAAAYYRAVLHTRAGQLDAAASLLAPLTAPRALLTLGTVEEYRGNFAEAARLHVEAIKAGQSVDPFAVAGASMQLAVIKGIEGDSQSAVNELRAMFPLVRQAARLHPHLWFQYHNEIAVELAAVGEADAARRAIAVALASPIAQAYPEWSETADELRERDAAAVIARNSGVVEAAAPKAQISTRRKERRRRIARNCYCKIIASKARPAARDLIAGSGERTRSAIIRTRANPRASPRAPPLTVHRSSIAH